MCSLHIVNKASFYGSGTAVFGVTGVGQAWHSELARSQPAQAEITHAIRNGMEVGLAAIEVALAQAAAAESIVQMRTAGAALCQISANAVAADCAVRRGAFQATSKLLEKCAIREVQSQLSFALMNFTGSIVRAGEAFKVKVDAFCLAFCLRADVNASAAVYLLAAVANILEAVGVLNADNSTLVEVAAKLAGKAIGLSRVYFGRYVAALAQNEEIAAAMCLQQVIVDVLCSMLASGVPMLRREALRALAIASHAPGCAVTFAKEPVVSALLSAWNADDSASRRYLARTLSGVLKLRACRELLCLRAGALLCLLAMDDDLQTAEYSSLALSQLAEEPALHVHLLECGMPHILKALLSRPAMIHLALRILAGFSMSESATELLADEDVCRAIAGAPALGDLHMHFTAIACANFCKYEGGCYAVVTYGVMDALLAVLRGADLTADSRNPERDPRLLSYRAGVVCFVKLTALAGMHELCVQTGVLAAALRLFGHEDSYLRSLAAAVVTNLSSSSSCRNAIVKSGALEGIIALLSDPNEHVVEAALSGLRNMCDMESARSQLFTQNLLEAVLSLLASDKSTRLKEALLRALVIITQDTATHHILAVSEFFWVLAAVLVSSDGLAQIAANILANLCLSTVGRGAYTGWQLSSPEPSETLIPLAVSLLAGATGETCTSMLRFLTNATATVEMVPALSREDCQLLGSFMLAAEHQTAMLSTGLVLNCCVLPDVAATLVAVGVDAKSMRLLRSGSVSWPTKALHFRFLLRLVDMRIPGVEDTMASEDVLAVCGTLASHSSAEIQHLAALLLASCFWMPAIMRQLLTSQTALEIIPVLTQHNDLTATSALAHLCCTITFLPSFRQTLMERYWMQLSACLPSWLASSDVQVQRVAVTAIANLLETWEIPATFLPFIAGLVVCHFDTTRDEALLGECLRALRNLAQRPAGIGPLLQRTVVKCAQLHFAPTPSIALLAAQALANISAHVDQQSSLYLVYKRLLDTTLPVALPQLHECVVQTLSNATAGGLMVDSAMIEFVVPQQGHVLAVGASAVLNAVSCATQLDAQSRTALTTAVSTICSSHFSMDYSTMLHWLGFAHALKESAFAISWRDYIRYTIRNRALPHDISMLRAASAAIAVAFAGQAPAGVELPNQAFALAYEALCCEGTTLQEAGLAAVGNIAAHGLFSRAPLHLPSIIERLLLLIRNTPVVVIRQDAFRCASLLLPQVSHSEEAAVKAALAMIVSTAASAHPADLVIQTHVANMMANMWRKHFNHAGAIHLLQSTTTFANAMRKVLPQKMLPSPLFRSVVLFLWFVSQHMHHIPALSHVDQAVPTLVVELLAASALQEQFASQLLQVASVFATFQRFRFVLLSDMAVEVYGTILKNRTVMSQPELCELQLALLNKLAYNSTRERVWERLLPSVAEFYGRLRTLQASSASPNDVGRSLLRLVATLCLNARLGLLITRSDISSCLLGDVVEGLADCTANSARLHELLRAWCNVTAHTPQACRLINLSACGVLLIEALSRQSISSRQRRVIAALVANVSRYPEFAPRPHQLQEALSQCIAVLTTVPSDVQLGGAVTMILANLFSCGEVTLSASTAPLQALLTSFLSKPQHQLQALSVIANMATHRALWYPGTEEALECAKACMRTVAGGMEPGESSEALRLGMAAVAALASNSNAYRCLFLDAHLIAGAINRGLTASTSSMRMNVGRVVVNLLAEATKEVYASVIAVLHTNRPAFVLSCSNLGLHAESETFDCIVTGNVLAPMLDNANIDLASTVLQRLSRRGVCHVPSTWLVQRALVNLLMATSQLTAPTALVQRCFWDCKEELVRFSRQMRSVDVEDAGALAQMVTWLAQRPPMRTQLCSLLMVPWWLHAFCSPMVQVLWVNDACMLAMQQSCGLVEGSSAIAYQLAACRSTANTCFTRVPLPASFTALAVASSEYWEQAWGGLQRNSQQLAAARKLWAHPDTQARLPHRYARTILSQLQLGGGGGDDILQLRLGDDGDVVMESIRRTIASGATGVFPISFSAAGPVHVLAWLKRMAENRGGVDASVLLKAYASNPLTANASRATWVGPSGVNSELVGHHDADGLLVHATSSAHPVMYTRALACNLISRTARCDNITDAAEACVLLLHTSRVQSKECLGAVVSSLSNILLSSWSTVQAVFRAWGCLPIPMLKMYNGLCPPLKGRSDRVALSAVEALLRAAIGRGEYLTMVPAAADKSLCHVPPIGDACEASSRWHCDVLAALKSTQASPSTSNPTVLMHGLQQRTSLIVNAAARHFGLLSELGHRRTFAQQYMDALGGQTEESALDLPIGFYRSLRMLAAVHTGTNALVQFSRPERIDVFHSLAMRFATDKLLLTATAREPVSSLANLMRMAATAGRHGIYLVNPVVALHAPCVEQLANVGSSREHIWLCILPEIVAASHLVPFKRAFDWMSSAAAAALVDTTDVFASSTIATCGFSICGTLFRFFLDRKDHETHIGFSLEVCKQHYLTVWRLYGVATLVHMLACEPQTFDPLVVATLHGALNDSSRTTAAIARLGCVLQLGYRQQETSSQLVSNVFDDALLAKRVLTVCAPAGGVVHQWDNAFIASLAILSQRGSARYSLFELLVQCISLALQTSSQYSRVSIEGMMVAVMASSLSDCMRTPSPAWVSSITCALPAFMEAAKAHLLDDSLPTSQLVACLSIHPSAGATGCPEWVKEWLMARQHLPQSNPALALIGLLHSTSDPARLDRWIVQLLPTALEGTQDPLIREWLRARSQWMASAIISSPISCWDTDVSFRASGASDADIAWAQLHGLLRAVSRYDTMSFENLIRTLPVVERVLESGAGSHEDLAAVYVAMLARRLRTHPHRPYDAASHRAFQRMAERLVGRFERGSVRTHPALIVALVELRRLEVGAPTKQTGLLGWSL